MLLFPNKLEMLVLFHKVAFFIPPPPPPMFVCHICLVSFTPPQPLPSSFQLSSFVLLYSFVPILLSCFCSFFCSSAVVFRAFLATPYYYSCHPDRSSFSLHLFLFLRHVRFLFSFLLFLFFFYFAFLMFL